MDANSAIGRVLQAETTVVKGAALLGAMMLGAICLAESRAEPAPTLWETITSKDGAMTLELRGDERFATEVWLKSSGSEQKTKVEINCDTNVHGGSISDDAQMLHFSYHISSGIYDEFLRKDSSGTYRHFLASGDLVPLVEKGQVQGLTIPNASQLRLECGFNGFRGSTERLPFELFVWKGPSLAELIYSTSERRVVEWRRHLLHADFSYERDKGPQFVEIYLQELSGERGTALSIETRWKEEDEERADLILFTPKQTLSRNEAKIHLKRPSDDGFVELVARPASGGSKERGEGWLIEISGKGAKFKTVRETLTKVHKSYREAGGQEADWPEPLRFLAEPASATSSRH